MLQSNQFFHYKNLNIEIELVHWMGTCTLVQPVSTQQITYEMEIAEQTQMASMMKIGQQKHKFFQTFEPLDTKQYPKQTNLKTLRFTHPATIPDETIGEDPLKTIQNIQSTQKVKGQEEEEEQEYSSQEIPFTLSVKQNSLKESVNKAALRRKSALAITGDFLKIKEKQASSEYKVLAKIANKVGQLYKVLDKTTNQIRSLQIIKQDQASALTMNEINLLKRLDHPNIYHLYDVFLKKGFYYVIGEYIEGDNISCLTRDNQMIPEKKLIKLMREIFQALNYLHFRGIMHRNIKPETIVFESKLNKTNLQQQFPAIKLINFKKATETNLIKEQVGNIYFMAPQMLIGSHNQKCDIWSVGVILYLLVSGEHPFEGQSKEEIHHKITGKDLLFKGKIWETKSQSLKALLRQLLNKSPSKRISAQQALYSSWLSQECDNHPVLISQGTMKNLLCLGSDSKFKTIIKTYLVKMTTSMQQRQQMAKKFQSIDKDQSGFIDKDQLRAAYKQIHNCEEISDSVNIDGIIKKIDINKSGLIDFSEFMAAVSHIETLFAKERLEKAFEFIDNDGTGEIEIGQLIELLNREIENTDMNEKDQQIVQIMKDFDHDGDKRISKEEFIEFFLKLKDAGVMGSKGKKESGELKLQQIASQQL